MKSKIDDPKQTKKEKIMSDGKTEFNCQKAGENSEATTASPGMQPRQDATINGNTDLSPYIQFNDDGKVYHITLQNSPGAYDYVIQVDAEGPHGAFSGSGHLEFTDETGDVYTLGIFSSHRSVHTVRYNSDKPGIVKIKWNN